MNKQLLTTEMYGMYLFTVYNADRNSRGLYIMFFNKILIPVKLV